jgi:hypothetical protein
MSQRSCNSTPFSTTGGVGSTLVPQEGGLSARFITRATVHNQAVYHVVFGTSPGLGLT